MARRNKLAYDTGTTRRETAETMRPIEERSPRSYNTRSKLVLRTKGAREAGVVAVILRDERPILKAVTWEDLR